LDAKLTTEISQNICSETVNPFSKLLTLYPLPLPCIQLRAIQSNKQGMTGRIQRRSKTRIINKIREEQIWRQEQRNWETETSNL